MAEGVISGKGSSLAALPSHRNRQKSSQQKFGDDGRQKFEKQLQDLHWGLKMQKKAKGKGERMWARRQIDKTKKKFAESWLDELEAKVKVSEVDKETAGWTSTAARNDFEKAKRLLEDKEKIQKKIRRRFKGEVERIEKIDEELQKLRAAAEAESSSEAQVVAAVRESSGIFEEKIGSSLGCRAVQEQKIEELQLRITELQGQVKEKEEQWAWVVAEKEKAARAAAEGISAAEREMESQSWEIEELELQAAAAAENLSAAEQ